MTSAMPKLLFRKSIVSGKASAEIRVMPSDWCPPVRAALEKGYVLRVENNRITVWNHTKEQPSSFGFNVQILFRHAERRNWTDEDMIDCLCHGFDYAFDETPPVYTFSPHYAPAMVMRKTSFSKPLRKFRKYGSRIFGAYFSLVPFDFCHAQL